MCVGVRKVAPSVFPVLSRRHPESCGSPAIDPGRAGVRLAEPAVTRRGTSQSRKDQAVDTPVGVQTVRRITGGHRCSIELLRMDYADALAGMRVHVRGTVQQTGMQVRPVLFGLLDSG